LCVAFLQHPRQEDEKKWFEILLHEVVEFGAINIGKRLEASKKKPTDLIPKA
jgi:hypothetical protein